MCYVLLKPYRITLSPVTCVCYIPSSFVICIKHIFDDNICYINRMLVALILYKDVPNNSAYQRMCPA